MWGKVNARKLRGGNEDDQCNFSKILKNMIFQSIEKSMVLLANACKYGVCERFYKNI